MVSEQAQLFRGIEHVERHIARLWSAPDPSGPARQRWLRARVTANALRELDRFLNLLVDATAHRAGVATRLDQRHTPNKLAALRRSLGMADQDHDQLLSVGRVRDCLFHCAGLVRRADHRHGQQLTLAWRRSDPHATATVALGGRLALTARDLLAICRLYRRVGTALLTDAPAGLSAPTAERSRAPSASSPLPPGPAPRSWPAPGRSADHPLLRHAC